MECDLQSGADVKSGGPNAGEKEVLRAADPKEGARLIRAFVKINDPSVRQKILDMVEQAWVGSIPDKLTVLSSIVDRASLTQRKGAV